jgi:hypothetical protein
MYYPKNKIKTNLYTRGDEYEIPNGEVYIGFYYSTHDGTYFTGKTPEENQIQTQLTPIIESSQTPSTKVPKFQSSPTLNIDNLGYNFIKSIPNNQNKLLPSQSYPKPTENDYKVGNFKRYFCVKTNEDIYLELDKKTYDKLSSKNSNWAHELYTTFQLVWYITGEESQVESTNKNLVLIQEQRSNRKGLKEFLRENYTKFYKP